jgi:N-acetylmuramate 1-kinase
MILLNELSAQDFLKKNNINNPQIIKVAGDASARSYYRIIADGQNWILMFAPPGYEEIVPFIAVDKILLENNISAPKIYAIDENEGFILLEDFGDDTYNKILAREQNNQVDLELELYKKACDCLIEVQKITIPQNLPIYDNDLLLREVSLLTDWYLKLKKLTISQQEIELFKTLWLELFNQISTENQALVLRDYHADNLMILPERNGYKQVGLLDFQDAVIGSKAYDLVSLLEDARRDLNEENRQKIFDYYLEKSGCDKVSFNRDYEILSLQRNIKIMGIFSRLSIRDNKNHYLSLLPRVLNFIKKRISSNNPTFLQIANLLEKFI